MGGSGPRTLFLAPSDVANDIERTVTAAVSEAGGHPIHPQDVTPPGVEWESVVPDAIASADLVVADITSGNPNIMYELGLAHAMRKATVLLIDEERGRSIPSDVARDLVVIYNGSGDLAPISQSVRRAVLHLARTRHFMP